MIKNNYNKNCSRSNKIIIHNYLSNKIIFQQAIQTNLNLNIIRKISK